MKRYITKKVWTLWLLTAGLGAAVTTARAQDIAQIAKSDPLIITGAVGTNNTFYHSSMGSSYATPFSSTFYASMNISVYGFSMPFSVYYATNGNFSFSYPHFSFNASPTYKNWTLHLGQRSMSFSNYVMAMPFNGVGIEYNSQHLRAGGFYGILRKAVNDDPENPNARTPQYQRTGWGGKVGVGSSSNYIDLYFLRAEDKLSSLYDAWRLTTPAAEDLVVGAKGRLSLGSWMSLQANVAGSVFSDDVTADTLKVEQLMRWDKIFAARYSSLARFAGDVSLNLNVLGVNAALTYKMIQPQYKSLGVSYLSNNLHSLGVSLSTMLFKFLSLSGSFSGQADNLSKQQEYTTSGYVYNGNMGFSLGQHFSLNTGYSGYRQMQSDGTAHVLDSTRVNRIMHNLFLSHAISFGGEALTHNLSPSFSYTLNKDLNPFTNKGKDGISTDVMTLAAGLGYSLGISSWGLNLASNYSHQQSVGYGMKYSTDAVSLGTSRSFLEDDALQASLNFSFALNNIIGQGRNMSYGADLSLGYTLKEVHVFSFTAGYNRFNNLNIVNAEEVAEYERYKGYDLSCSLNYNYTFSLLEIKHKEKEEATQQNAQKYNLK